jgi:hypothetical protein
MAPVAMWTLIVSVIQTSHLTPPIAITKSYFFLTEFSHTGLFLTLESLLILITLSYLLF